MTSFPSSFLSDVFETSDVARDYFYVLSHIQLFATLWTVAHQAPLSMGILQARILEWIAIPSSRGSSQLRDRNQVSHIADGFFTIWTTREAPLLKIPFVCSVTNSCPTLWDLMVYSPPGSSVHGILQARILEWVATSFSMGSSWPRDRTSVSCISCIGRRILYHWATWETWNSLNFALLSQS